MPEKLSKNPSASCEGAKDTDQEKAETAFSFFAGLGGKAENKEGSRTLLLQSAAFWGMVNKK
jgi:hypothetical protein